MCESRRGRPGLPVLTVPSSLYGLCGCKATFEEEEAVGEQSLGAL